MAVELATAYVSVVPSTKGMGAKLAAELGGMSAAGSAAGGQAASGFGAKFLPAMAGIAAAGAAAIAGIGVGLFAIGSSFDEAWDTIRVGTGATGADLDALKASFKNVVTDVPADFGDAGTAIADLNTRLGLTGEPLEAMAEQLLELSRITDTDLGTNIETSTRLLADWGVENENAAAALDRVFRASQATGPSVDTLSRLMVQYGGPMRQLGFSFNETAALLGQFEREGVNTELVMGSMRIALGKMARDGEPAAETLRRVMGEIKNAGTASEANAKALELFGARAGPDMAAAIREGRFEVNDLLETIAGGDETIMGAAADTESFGEKWTKLKNKVLVKLEPVATRVFEAVGDAMDWLAAEVMPRVEEGLVVLRAWWDENGPAITATVRDLADRIGSALRTVIDFVAENWPKLESGFRTFVDFVRTNVLPTVQAIADKLTATLGPIIEQVAATVVPLVQDVARSISDAFANVVAWVEEHWPQIEATITIVLDSVRAQVETVLGVIQFIWEAVGANILGAVEVIWQQIQDVIGGVMKVIGGIIETVMALISGDWGAAWDGIKNVAAGVWDTIAGVVEGAIGLIGEILGGLGSLLVDLVKGPLDNMAGWASEAVDKVVGFITGLPERIGGIGQAIGDAIVGGLKAAWNAAVGAINDLIPNDIGVGPASIDLPDNPLPVLHEGGIVPGRPGTETLALLEAGEVVLSRSQVAAGTAGTGQPIEVVVKVGDAELARQIIPALRAVERSFA